MSEIKPCPVCGCDVEVDVYQHNPKKCYAVCTCIGCSYLVDVGAGTEGLAVAAHSIVCQEAANPTLHPCPLCSADVIVGKRISDSITYFVQCTSIRCDFCIDLHARNELSARLCHNTISTRLADVCPPIVK